MNRFTNIIGILSLCLSSVACDTDVADPSTTVDHNDAGTADAGMALPPMASERSPVAPLPATESCSEGTVAACMCTGGMPGTRACIGNGQLSECGCVSPSGPDTFVAPTPPVVLTCGNTQCDVFEEEETSVSARACCTATNTCGSSSGFLFGGACIARGSDPGVPSEKCPDEAPNFVDLYGCCRPDGQCGLSIDHVANFDLGCIERTEMSAMLNAGSLQRDLLSLVFLLPNPKTAFARIQCK